jgi:hypothetical protein
MVAEQRADHVAQLDAGAIGRGERAEAGDEDARHEVARAGSSIKLARRLESLEFLRYYRAPSNRTKRAGKEGRRTSPAGSPGTGGSTVKRLIQYLRENMILDFQGDMTLEMLREMLKDDDSREARALRAKVVEDRGVNDMMLVLADCLLEVVQRSLPEEAIREQLSTYAES